ncbi:MAG: C39 family peptidase [Candidatus Poribacteria bacterium]|nr:C39 family peptidase [Candidatus Poribacteria bacterium]
MSHRIRTQKAILCVVLSIFFVFIASGISYGNPNALARKVYEEHTKTLTRADILEVLPEVLEALKAPKVQPLLNDRSIKLIANNPDLLKTFLPDVDNAFIRLLKTDAQIKKLIRDANFQKVLQDPVAIDALVARMTDDGMIDDILPEEEPPVDFGDGGGMDMALEKMVIYESTYSSTFQVDGEVVYITYSLLRSNEAYRPGSKHKVIFTVVKQRTRKPVPSVRLSLSTHRDSTTTATFSPAAITTDKNGQAETEITFSKNPGRFSMSVEIDPGSSWVSMSLGYSSFQRVDLKYNLSPGYYLPGSKHKLRLTLKNAQTGKPMPSIGLNLSANTRKTTATFSPAAITTDKNGQAETEIAFGKQPGLVSVSIEIKTSRSVTSRSVTFNIYGSTEDTAITLDGESGKNLGFHLVSYTLEVNKTRKKLVVKVKDARQHSMDIFFKDISRGFKDISRGKGSVTFEPETVRTDKNGWAFTYVTFGEGVKDLTLGIEVVKLNVLDKNQYGANVYNYSDGNQAVLIKGLELNVDTSQVQSDFTLRKYLFSKNDGYIDRDSKHFKLYNQGNRNACGQTSARMLMSYYGVDADVFDLGTFWSFYDLKQDPTFGTPSVKLKVVLNEVLPVKVDRYSGTSADFSRHASLRQKVSRSRPPMILLRCNGGFGFHYVLVVGYDTKYNKFLIADPWEMFHWVPWKTLNSSWFLSAEGGKGYEQYLKDDLGAEGDRNKKDGKIGEEKWYTGIGISAAKFADPDGLDPYTMLVPKKAPPYHHLESETDFRVSSVSQGKWKEIITVNGPIEEGRVVARSGRSGASLDEIFVEGNRFIYSGTGKSGDLISSIVTIWYKPGPPAAPVLPLPPGTTVLLPNYPNPFNPETWIPYHLAKPADVTLTIYAIDGKVVRHLDLGHQAAGFYQSKSRAAHWDGRNDVGERVASGIYFYTLTAGEFAATQKMLIVK